MRARVFSSSHSQSGQPYIHNGRLLYCILVATSHEYHKLPKHRPKRSVMNVFHSIPTWNRNELNTYLPSHYIRITSSPTRQVFLAPIFVVASMKSFFAPRGCYAIAKSLPAITSSMNNEVYIDIGNTFLNYILDACTTLSPSLPTSMSLLALRGFPVRIQGSFSVDAYEVIASNFLTPKHVSRLEGIIGN